MHKCPDIQPGALVLRIQLLGFVLAGGVGFIKKIPRHLQQQTEHSERGVLSYLSDLFYRGLHKPRRHKISSYI